MDPRIVLTEGAPTARVERDAGSADVPILIARAGEDAAGALAKAPGDGALLQAGAAVAWARVGGETLPDLPLYAMRADGSEVRVRVAQIRERSAAGKESLLGRLRKK